MMHKFSIVAYLKPALAKKIRKLQKKVSKATNSNAILKLWKPHLTIGSGVKVSDKELKGLYADMKAVISNFKSFKITLKHCDSMDDWTGGELPGHTPYVIYLKIILNKKLLRLAKIVKKKVTAKRKIWYRQPWPYKPHVTLAYRDLSKKTFIKGKRIFEHEKFSGETVINHISLVKENNSGKWIEYKRFKF